MDKYVALINNPLLQTVLAIIGILGSIYLAFQKVKRPDYRFHKERNDLVQIFLDEFDKGAKRKLAVEELFSYLWNTKSIKYGEIKFLMNLDSPRYFMNLYVLSKGYVEIKDHKITVTKKYGLHPSGLEKEEKSLKKFYFAMGGVLAFIFPTLLTMYSTMSLSTILFFIFLIFILIVGMVIALFEVRKVYSGQRLIEEYYTEL